MALDRFDGAKYGEDRPETPVSQRPRVLGLQDLNKEMSRRDALRALFATGVVAGVSLLPRSTFAADDASSGDAGSSDAGSMDAGSTDAGSTPQDNPNTLTTDIAEIEFDLRGGPESDFWLYFRNGGGVVSGDLIGVPTNFPQPAGYMMVNDGNGGTVHFFEWLKAKGIGVLQVVTDIDTNNHDIGHKTAMTADPNGMRSSIPVERAATYGGGSSFAYLADNGVGMPFTGGLPVGAGSLDVTTLLKLAQPYGTNSKNFIFPPDLVTFIQNTHKQEIDAALATKHHLPAFKRYIDGEAAARSASQQVIDFAQKIINGSKNPGNDKLANAADIFLQLFQAKQAYGVSLTTPGSWDRHGDVNGTQSMGLYQSLMNSIVTIVNRAEELGVKARLVFKGDFNRTGLGTDSSHHKFAAPVIMGMPGTMGPGLDGQHRRIGQFDGNKVLTKDQYSTMGDVHAFQQQLPGNRLLDVSFNGMDFTPPPSALTDGVPDRIQKLLDLG